MNATSRSADLTVSVIGDELVVNDLANGAWHALDASKSAVFTAADGSRGLTDIATATGLTAAQVVIALQPLADADLVIVPGVSRRALVTRGA